MQKVAFAFAAVAMTGALTTLTTTPAFAGTEDVTIDTSADNLGGCQADSVDDAMAQLQNFAPTPTLTLRALR